MGYSMHSLSLHYIPNACMMAIAPSKTYFHRSQI